MSQQSSVIGAFGEEDAIKLSGVTLSQLRLWDRNGILNASYAKENRRQPYSRVYSFRDLVSLRVLNRLRNEYHVSGQHLKEVSDTLAHMGDDRWISTTLFVLNRKVVFDDPLTDLRREIVGGQRVFDIPLKAAVSDTHKAIRKLNERTSDELGKVTKKRFLMNNQTVFDGTRIPVSTVIHYLERGYSDKRILSDYPDLAPSDIDAARALAVTDAA